MEAGFLDGSGISLHVDQVLAKIKRGGLEIVSLKPLVLRNRKTGEITKITGDEEKAIISMIG